MNTTPNAQESDTFRELCKLKTEIMAEIRIDWSLMDSNEKVELGGQQTKGNLIIRSVFLGYELHYRVTGLQT